MNKYSFLLHSADYFSFLDELREIGVVHIEERKHTEEENSKTIYENQIGEFDKAIKLLISRKQHLLENTHDSQANVFTILNKINETETEIDRLNSSLSLVNKEIAHLQPWGEFNPEEIKKLENNGVESHFFISTNKKFNDGWLEKYALEIISRDDKNTYFIVFNSQSEKVALNAEELHLPDFSLSQLQKQKNNIEEKLNLLNTKLDKHAQRDINLLKNTKYAIEDKLEFLNVILNSEKASEGKLMILQGFVPVTHEEELLDYLERNEIYYLHKDSEIDDHPPVLLKNNKFSKLFEPIGKLFSLPSYTEMDLTPFFAPFFMLFFGFCLGDAGYGLVLMLIATYLKFSSKNKISPALLTLVQLLGAATVLVGIFTGNFLGISHKGLDLKQSYHSLFLTENQIFNLAIIIGIIQILFGIVLQAWKKIKKDGWVHALPQLGWFIIIASIIDMGFLKLTGIVATYLMYTGFLFILLFAAPKSGIVERITKGIWELYGITGLFGDVLSYVRLFALGISSSILGLVVNSIALEILEINYVGPVLFFLFLIFGHVFNLFIASLGAFVHPLRLTFVEFYKNAGFDGGGKKYNPFRKKLTTNKKEF